MNQFLNYLFSEKKLNSPCKNLDSMQCYYYYHYYTTVLWHHWQGVIINSEYQIQSIDSWSSWSGHTEHKPVVVFGVSVTQSWSEVTVIRVTRDSKGIILNDLVTSELFVTWLALYSLVTWLDLLGLQLLVCDLRVLKSCMRTRYSRNGSCNLQNCRNLEKIFVIRNFIGQNLLIRRKTPN